MDYTKLEAIIEQFEDKKNLVIEQLNKGESDKARASLEMFCSELAELSEEEGLFIVKQFFTQIVSEIAAAPATNHVISRSLELLEQLARLEGLTEYVLIIKAFIENMMAIIRLKNKSHHAALTKIYHESLE